MLVPADGRLACPYGLGQFRLAEPSGSSGISDGVCHRLHTFQYNAWQLRWGSWDGLTRPSPRRALTASRPDLFRRRVSSSRLPEAPGQEEEEEEEEGRD